MPNSPLAPAIDLLQLFENKLGNVPEKSRQRLSELLQSRLIHDLLDTPDFYNVDRDVFRQTLGLKRLEADILHLEVGIGNGTVEQWLASVTWVTNSYHVPGPKNNVERTSKHKFRMVPFKGEQVAEMAQRLITKNGWLPADFRETLSATLTLQKTGCFICPIPIPFSTPPQRPMFYAVVRTPKGLHLIMHDFFRVFREHGFVNLGPTISSAGIKVKRHEIYIATTEG